MIKTQNSKFKIKNFSAGFSLIEVTVSVMVFSIVMVLVSAIFTRAVELERRTVWSQRVQENSTLILETIAKEVRVSEVISSNSPTCSATSLIINHPTACNGSPCNVTYSLSGTNVQRQAGFTSFVNSSDILVTRFNFCITGTGTNDDESAKVTILMTVQSLGGSPPVKTNVQTSVISRDITSELQNL